MIHSRKPLRGKGLMALFAAAYFVSYLTRVNYGAVISEMITATGYSKQMLSMAVTGSFFTYGAGQIVSGLCGDLVSPKKLLGAGLLVTACMNLILPFCPTPWHMLAVWCVNGFSQAFMWPPLIKLMSVLLSEEDYHKGVVWTSYGCSGATIAIYLLSPVLISFLGWKSVFISAGICGGIMLAAWLLLCPETEGVGSKPVESGAADGRKLLFSPMMLGVMVAIALHGILKDGVATWMPTYISETYNASNFTSILSGTVMPIFGVVSVKVGAALYKKGFSNPVTCAAVIFGVSCAAALVLALISGGSALLSVVLMALLTGSMHAVNLMLVSSIPPLFKKYGTVSTASGILNACTYIGSAASTYGIAVVSEGQGWQFTLWLWVLIALASALLCLVCSRPIGRKLL